MESSQGRDTILRQILVVSGPSGVGKTTLCEHLLRLERRLKPCITATTRQPRPGEKDGRDYHFLTVKGFTGGIRNKKFVEYTRLFGNYYGTPVASLNGVFRQGRYPLLRVDVRGARALKRKGFKGVYIFILPPDARTLKQRLIKRQSRETLAEINKRLKRARAEMRYARDYDFHVINDRIARAVGEMRQIVKKNLY
ncbi:MAG: guanylate kinase [Planctomycetes bacterium]|nr:guanylate kinase [Planctomycetota bacterium]